jgi:hypothetical protein
MSHIFSLAIVIVGGAVSFGGDAAVSSGDGDGSFGGSGNDGSWGDGVGVGVGSLDGGIVGS